VRLDLAPCGLVCTMEIPLPAEGEMSNVV
jgi:hypothetical protein